jgi:phenylalanyl-tRNA synthetase beta chain
MRVPLSWLRDYVDFDLEPQALAEKLTLLGMEVKGVNRIGSDWENVVVGELLEVGPHPNSTKLQLTKVRVGPSHPILSIVCGAHNIEAGQHVPVALPGAVLPGDRRIEVTGKAGVESQGMLCSGDELRVDTDADGILILEPDAPIGMPVAELIGDVVLDVDVKPNRGDALSMIGLAREVAAAVGSTLRWPTIEVPESTDRTTDHVSVQVMNKRGCPRIVLRYVDGVAVRPSPARIQRRLLAAGMRPISSIVDASNYVMLELGKPIHTFDAAAVAGGTIVVRDAKSDETLETLDHVTRQLDADTLVIADARGPIGIAGVMGGANSEVDSSTEAVIIESAIFDPVSIRRTAFRYALRSEASLRFEKGQEHRLARIGADRTAQLIAEWSGARPAIGVVDTDPHEPEPARLPFRPARVSRLLGIDVSADEQRDLLKRVEVATEAASASDAVPVIDGEAPRALTSMEAAEALVALVPTHRRDLRIEADIAEEIARVRGYETVPAALPVSESPPYRSDPRLEVDRLRSLLSGRGVSEVITFALVSAEDHQRLGLPETDARTIRAANPVSSDHAELRRSLLPGLLRVLGDNERQRRDDVRIFEMGDVHLWVGADARADGREPDEHRILGILVAGAGSPPLWQEPARAADLGDLKGLLEATVERLAPGTRLRFGPAEPRPGIDHPGRVSTVQAMPTVVEGAPATDPVGLGTVGELHPRLLEVFDIRTEHVLAAELDLAPLLSLVPERRRVELLERLPAVERDIALVVKASAPAGDIAEAIRAGAGASIASVILFDRYQGPPLAADEVNLAFRLRFQGSDSALSEAALDGTIERLRGVLAERFGARLRD